MSKLSPWTGSVAIHLVVIAVLGLFAYSNTFDVPFQWDEESSIVENPIIKDVGYFLSPSKAADFPEYAALKGRFVGYLTFALNYRLHGLDVTGYHVVNLAIHIFNALLVYFLVLLTFRTPYISEALLKKHGRYVALFSALLFVSHPVQTQAVTYIVQRFTSLATFFYLASLVAYIKSRLSDRKTERVVFYALSLLSAVMAMKTKEIAFTLPLAIALYEYMFFRGGLRKRFLWLAPLLVTMLIIPLSLVISVDKPLDEIIGGVDEATRIRDISRADYLLTQSRVIVTYLRLLVLPANQNLYYDYPVYHSFFEPSVFLSFLFLFGVFGLGVYCFYRSSITDNSSEFGVRSSEIHVLRITHHSSRLVAFGIFWFFLTLLVESTLIPLHVIFEHRVYLPSVGMFSAFATGVFLLAGKLKGRKTKALAVSSLILVPLVFSCATYARNSVWQSEVSLWEDVVRKSPHKAKGHNNLGRAYSAEGLFDKAIRHYQIAVKMFPHYEFLHYNLGNAYKSRGLTDKAIEHYRTALRLKPDFAKAQKNLGIVYYKKGLTDKAIEHYRTALRLKPDDADTHYNLGLIYFEKGHTDKARGEFQTALQINPAHYQARRLLNRTANPDKSPPLKK